MTAPHPETHEVVAPGDLKALAAAHGPCLTALAPLPDRHIESQVKNAIQGLQKKLAEQATDRKTISSLLEPVFDLAVTPKTEGIWPQAMILFRSPDLFQYYLLHGQFKEAQTVDNRFHVRPLLRTLAHETRFHLLGLSQRHVRLWHCTQHRAEPAATHGFPTNFQAWLYSRQPFGGISTDREREDEYLRHFFKEVDKGVTADLHSGTGPLLLAGVERDIAIYRRVNSYKPTLEKVVNGSPDGIPDRTLHERAMEVVAGTFSESLQRVMMTIPECVGTPAASTDPRSIVQAAFEGRVLDLVIAANAEYFGVWNEETYSVETGRREELLNAAALQTLRHGGRAFVLDERDMPVKAAAAAVFRF